MKLIYFCWACVALMPVAFYVWVPYTPPVVDIQKATEEYRVKQAIADRNLMLFIRGYEDSVGEDDLMYGSSELVEQAEMKLD